MIPAIIVSSIVIFFLAVIFIRALRFKPEKRVQKNVDEIFTDTDRAVHSLCEMIKCKTVSYNDKALEDEGEFNRFKNILPILFPNVYKTCEFQEVSDRALLFKWNGQRSDAPTVLMAHYDVVSVTEEGWEKPAFDAIIENGVIWGRGALDTKATLNGILSAVEVLIKEGFVPQNDVYMAFGGDEEVNGHGAKDIVEYFKERNIVPGIVVDEGGAVVNNVFPGVNSPCALIGIAEKGMLNVEYSVKGGGGHSSSPLAHTPVGRLSSACVKIEGSPFKFHITPPARKMFDTLARHSGFAYRLIFANLWLFAPILNIITKSSGGELNALVRTTIAFTQMEGSKGMNVIPPYAKMVSNHRIIPGETTESVISRIRNKVKDDNVEIRMINGMNPSRVSVTDGEAWERLCKATSETWNDAIVSPYLMLACSDSRHWGEISDKVYRFSAMALTKEERGLIHGNNERIPISTVAKTVEFYIRLIKNS